MIVVQNGELYHYGMPKRSGRYPWGSGKNPFHHSGKNGSGRVQKKKEKSHVNVKINKRGVNLDVSKKTSEPVSSQNKEKVKKPSIDRKAEIINSGDPQLINKYKEHLTTDEINRAIGKVKASQAIEALAKESQKSGLDTVEDMLDKGVRIADNVDKGIRIYNTVAKVANTVSAEPILPTARDYTRTDMLDYKKKKYDAKRTELHYLNSLDKRTKTKTQEKTDKLKQETDLTKAKTENLRSARELTEEKERTRDYINEKERQHKESAAAEKQAKKEEKQAKKEARQAKKEFYDSMDSSSERRRQELNVGSDKDFDKYINEKVEERRATQENINTGKEYTDQWLAYMDRLNK